MTKSYKTISIVGIWFSVIAIALAVFIGQSVIAQAKDCGSVTAGKEVTVNITDIDETYNYSFKPAEAGTYELVKDADIYVSLYDKDDDYVDYNYGLADSNWNRKREYSLNAGEEYTVRVSADEDEGHTGTFKFTISKAATLTSLSYTPVNKTLKLSDLRYSKYDDEYYYDFASGDKLTLVYDNGNKRILEFGNYKTDEEGYKYWGFIEKSSGLFIDEDYISLNYPTIKGYGSYPATLTYNDVKTSFVINVPENVKVSGIQLGAISHKIAAGKKVVIAAKVLPDSATNKTLTWKSSNTKLAKVDAKGSVKLTKKAAGKTVTITAYAADGSGVKASFIIKGMKGVVKKVTIAGKKKVKAGKSLKLKATTKATKGANKKLRWTSSNTSYATVTKSGKVKTFAAGKGKTVKITARATDGSGKKKTVKIKIK